jgi:hypothetical protein
MVARELFQDLQMSDGMPRDVLERSTDGLRDALRIVIVPASLQRLSFTHHPDPLYAGKDRLGDGDRAPLVSL